MHLTQGAPCARQINASEKRTSEPLNKHLFFGSWLEPTAPLSPGGRHTKPAEQQELETYFASLGNGVLHDASDIGNGEVDVLLPEVLFNAAVVVVVQTLVCVVCTEKGGREKRRRETTDRELMTRVDFFAFPGRGSDYVTADLSILHLSAAHLDFATCRQSGHHKKQNKKSSSRERERAEQT